MRKNQISPSVIQDLFESASNAAEKGQAQWFTPLSWARVLAQPLPNHRPAIVDLTCGNGQLLAGAAKKGSQLFGCDIEANGQFLAADVTRFFPLLVAVNWQADLFVLNPPWDLHWYREKLASLAKSDCAAVRGAFAAHDGRTSHDTIDSTIATLCLGVDRCSPYGEGFLIGNEATLRRLVFASGAPHRSLAAHCWAHLVINGNICSEKLSGTNNTGVLYFSRGHLSGVHRGAFHNVGTLAEAEAVCAALHKNRLLYRDGAEVKSYAFTEDTVEVWQAVADEYRTSIGKTTSSQFNLWLDSDGFIRTHLSLFDTRSGRIKTEDASALFALNGKQPIQLVLQRAQRKALEASVAPGSPWHVDPALQAAVQEAIAEYHKVRAPLYPLPKIQRLGYLDEQDEIECVKDLFLSGLHVPAFRSGRRYALRSVTIAVRRNGEKMNLQGELDTVEWNGQELAFFITDETGTERLFMEGRLRDPAVKLAIQDEGTPSPIEFTLRDLIECFDVPDVPDVAAINPAGYEANLNLLAQIEQLAA